jgi:Zn-dependent peptidase ImmA (M78 family)
VLIRKVDGRTYSDPDIVSLIDESGGLLDPYSVVRHGANSLLRQLENFEVTFNDAFQRICILASLVGLAVKPMDVAQAAQERRDAVLVYTEGNGKKGVIFFNPEKPKPRVVFSIAHEITHSFLPTSRTAARFRAICAEGSRSARELEMLCHFSASELTMPRNEFTDAVNKFGFDLASVESVRQEFGTSFEACTYRMAETAPFPAAAGLLKFRLKVGEEHASAGLSGELFPIGSKKQETPARKYRRQSFYYSETLPRGLIIPWNKSFPETSCVYEAARTRAIASGYQVFPLHGRGRVLDCFLEAVSAPYQPSDVDSKWPDILFLLRADLR